MDTVGKALVTFGREAAMIAASPGTTEATFYPAVQRLVAAILDARQAALRSPRQHQPAACRAFLANVPERVWRYELGGYPVIKKWLGYRDAKRRPGRPLSLDELDHLRSMVHRIAALLILHDRLDGAYETAIADPFTGEELGV